jgi:hypothetical protein
VCPGTSCTPANTCLREHLMQQRLAPLHAPATEISSQVFPQTSYAWPQDAQLVRRMFWRAKRVPEPCASHMDRDLVAPDQAQVQAARQGMRRATQLWDDWVLVSAPWCLSAGPLRRTAHTSPQSGDAAGKAGWQAAR